MQGQTNSVLKGLITIDEINEHFFSSSVFTDTHYKFYHLQTIKNLLKTLNIAHLAKFISLVISCLDYVDQPWQS